MHIYVQYVQYSTVQVMYAPTVFFWYRSDRSGTLDRYVLYDTVLFMYTMKVHTAHDGGRRISAI
jgi:hypothetical protein